MDNKFQKNNYSVIKNAISKELSEFVYNYFLMKRQVAQTLINTKYISPFNADWGWWQDEQVPQTYSHYGDIAMETLLNKLHPAMEKETGLSLNPTYAYARIYKNGDVLERHKDRFSCEISTTLNLGGDEWPIFIEAKENVGIPEEGFPPITKNPGSKIILKPGDMLVYKGNLCEHWREKFEGENCAQVFLHYNNTATDGSDKNIFDGRKHLGLPSYFKNKEF